MGTQSLVNKLNKINVLFVCTGNICRSPLAEAIMRDYVINKHLDQHFNIDSAGTHDYHVGSLADQRSIDVAKENNINITHKARQITEDDFTNYHFIFVMDDMNYRIVKELADKYDSDSQIKYLREFDSNAKYGSYSLHVPDPYYSGDDAFNEVFLMCKRSIEAFVNSVIKPRT